MLKKLNNLQIRDRLTRAFITVACTPDACLSRYTNHNDYYVACLRRNGR